VGESVGFFRFDAGTAGHLARVVAAHVATAGRDLPHEEALRELALSGAAFAQQDNVLVDMSGIEIAFPYNDQIRDSIINPADGTPEMINLSEGYEFQITGDARVAGGGGDELLGAGMLPFYRPAGLQRG
ncbi:MAG TPA: hypothetical protein DCZ11_02300, partial [Gammaproteobacteria bacterium]|nr:hypothetical protein [Gammaproteobacteria bacterium]MCH77255.1 hypothetical protein [Gammaproteobacteria bacterium]